MSIEIKQQIIEVAKELTNLYGDDYGDQYSKVANNVLQLSTDDNNQYLLLIEASYALIDSDYKDKIILYLQKKVKEQDIKIKEQDIKIKEQDIKIKEQEVKIKEQEVKIKEQEVKIDYLTKKLNIYEQNQLYKKYIISIQDYNRLELLETKLQNPYELNNLRSDRLGECHYIDDNYCDDEKAHRINTLIDKINNTPEYIANKFEDDYPGLLEQIKSIMIKRIIGSNINPRIIKRANTWWEI
jgi:uncharacterized coiled-coil protein SlyX